jgi:hypothetical protein
MVNAFEAGVMVQIHLDLQEFGNAHEMLVMVLSQIQIEILHYLWISMKLSRGMRLFNGGGQLSQHAKYNKNQSTIQNYLKKHNT